MSEHNHTQQMRQPAAPATGVEASNTASESATTGKTTAESATITSSATAPLSGTVTLRVSRFTPRTETPETAKKPSNPFASKRTNPFASSHSGSPRRTRGKRWSQDYTLNVHGEETLLDCLLNVKRTLDPTLAFRYSCGHGICGSDAVSVNGTAVLLCTTTVEQCAQSRRSGGGGNFRHTTNPESAFPRAADTDTSDTSDTSDANASEVSSPTHFDRRQGTISTDPSVNNAENEAINFGIIEIAPLAGFAVLRDLIVDIDHMMEQIRSLEPYLKASGEMNITPNGDIDMFEYLQSPEDLKQYEQLTNCISCGICEASCPVYSGGEAFIGPAALVSASRFINDSRDSATDERLEAIKSEDGIAACQSVRACSRPCPRGIDVGEEMWRLTTRVNA